MMSQARRGSVDLYQIQSSKFARSSLQILSEPIAEVADDEVHENAEGKNGITPDKSAGKRRADKAKPKDASPVRDESQELGEMSEELTPGVLADDGDGEFDEVETMALTGKDSYLDLRKEKQREKSKGTESASETEPETTPKEKSPKSKDKDRVQEKVVRMDVPEATEITDAEPPKSPMVNGKKTSHPKLRQRKGASVQREDSKLLGEENERKWRADDKRHSDIKWDPRGSFARSRRGTLHQVIARKRPGEHNHSLFAGGSEFEFLRIETVFFKLESSELGLAEEEARKRLDRDGPNTIPPKKRNHVLLFLRHFLAPFNICLLLVAVVAIGLLQYVTFGLLMGFLIFTVFLGYLAELHTIYVMSALRVASATTTKTLRNGEYKNVPTSELVRGDVIRIKQGDVIPADVKLLHGDPIEVDQSSLSGETLPLFKYAGDEAYSGSLCTRGEIEAVVYTTGKNTAYAKHLSATNEKLEEKASVSAVVTFVGIFSFCFVLFWVALELIFQFGIRPGLFIFSNHPPIGTQFEDLVNLYASDDCTGGVGGCPLLFSPLVILISGLPMGFPVLFSFILSVGASKLLSKGIVVAHFGAIQKIAAMDVICVDKIGVLTVNELTIDRALIMTVNNFTEKDVIFHAALASRTEDGEQIDLCIVNSLDEDSLNELADYSVISYYPFDALTKRTMVELEDPQGTVLRVVKGSPNSILSICGLSEEMEGMVEDKVAEFARLGHRVVAVAKSYSPKNFNDGALRWEMVGLIPFCDPPRHDTQSSVQEFHQLGINVKMITDDQLLMAIESSRLFGLSSDVHAARCLDNPSELCDLITLDHFVQKSAGFAEATPHHKFQIILRLQKLGKIVGVTGETAEDVPALQEASVGIATPYSSDAAKSSSDVILLLPGLTSLIKGTRSAGKTFHTLRELVLFALSNVIQLTCTFGLLTVGWNFNFPPLLAVFILLLNFTLTMALPLDQIKLPGKAETWNHMKIVILAVFSGMYLTASSLVFFDLLGKHHEVFTNAGALPLYVNTYEGRARIQTALFLQVVVSGQLHLFICRAKTFSFFQPPSIILTCVFVLTQLAAIFIAVYGILPYNFVHVNVPVGDVIWRRDSFLGCGWGYALAAWIWSIMWYIPLDLLNGAVHLMWSRKLFKSPLETQLNLGHPYMGKSNI